MNQEKNYQKSDHNKKQKKSFIDLIKLQTNYILQTKQRTVLWLLRYIYIFLPLTKNYLMFIDYFQKNKSHTGH